MKPQTHELTTYKGVLYRRKLREKVDKETKPKDSYDDPLAEMLRVNNWKPFEDEPEDE